MQNKENYSSAIGSGLQYTQRLTQNKTINVEKEESSKLNLTTTTLNSGAVIPTRMNGTFCQPSSNSKISGAYNTLTYDTQLSSRRKSLNTSHHHHTHRDSKSRLNTTTVHKSHSKTKLAANNSKLSNYHIAL